jgi:hypothetical protein
LQRLCLSPRAHHAPAPASNVPGAGVTENHPTYGVEPICEVLPIAPSAARSNNFSYKPIDFRAERAW